MKNKIKYGIIGATFGLILSIILILTPAGKTYFTLTDNFSPFTGLLVIFPYIFFILLGFLLGILLSK